MLTSYLLIDHDNLADPPTFLSRNIIPWLEAVLGAKFIQSGTNIEVVVRVYGGWFNGTGTTDKRQEAFLYYSQHWPTIFLLGTSYIRFRVEFADTLVLNSGRRPKAKITHTLRLQKRLPRFSRTDVAKTCLHPNCEIAKVAKWTKRQTGCFSSMCPHTFSDCFSRLEQKQVDVHLAADLMLLTALSTEPMCIGICSEDTDLTPAVLAAATVLEQLGKKTLLAMLRDNQRPYHSDLALEELGIFIHRSKLTA
jgi:uncharacterized LabA/DUF88 family protein